MVQTSLANRHRIEIKIFQKPEKLLQDHKSSTKIMKRSNIPQRYFVKLISWKRLWQWRKKRIGGIF